MNDLPIDGVEITGCDLVAFIKKAYELSRVQGMGTLHARPGSLSDDDAQAIISQRKEGPISIDYLHGRAVKLTIHRFGQRLVVGKRWFDHSQDELRELLAVAGKELPQ